MTTKKNTGIFSKFLKTVETLGNILPHPVTLFAIFCGLVLFSSQLFEFFELSVIDPRPVGSKGRSPDGLIKAVGLLNGEGIRKIFLNLVKNFSNFAPLGTVLVAMLAVGVAEYSGLLTAFIRRIVLKAPDKLVTFIVVLAGIISNTASELGYVVLIPLGGYIFLSKGRHPIAGMAAAFAGVSGGYSANLFVGTLDPLLAGITNESVKLISADYEVSDICNYYFMAASTFLIAAIATFVTEKIVEPNLGKYDSEFADDDIDTTEALKPLSKKELKGLKWAIVTIGLLGIVAALTVIPENGVLRDPNAAANTNFVKQAKPFFKGIIAWIFIFFLIPSIVFGKITGSIKNDKDVIKGMTLAMERLGLYLVLVFFAAQFIAFFNWTNLGTIFAVYGAGLLQNLGATGPSVFFLFIILCCFVNLMLGSASAQWAVTAPIFVPMLMLLGYSPEIIQAAYRIGDSSTNIITPMMSYFGLIFSFALKFDKKLGIGTLISTMLPYSLFFVVTWSLFFYFWVFILGLPVGPGAPIYFSL